MKNIWNRPVQAVVQAAAVGASILALTASPAMADPDHDRGRGHEKHGRWHDDDRGGDWRGRDDDRRVVVVNRRAPVRVSMSMTITARTRAGAAITPTVIIRADMSRFA
jgi:hypothetical protein